MRLCLILPDGNIHKVSLGRFGRSMREAPLTMTTLAAMVPAGLEVDLELIDESVNQRVSFDKPFDLVAISVLTGTSSRAYAIADEFRRRGVQVVLGGVHVTLRPEEAAVHADAIVIGPGEGQWPELLLDFTRGAMRNRYEAPLLTTDEAVRHIPPPRRDLQRYLRYNIPNTVWATRGCRHACDFCSVPTYIHGYAKRPIADVVEDIRQAPPGLLAINDVSLVDDVDYAKELFAAMAPLRRKWGGLATVHVAHDPQLLELLRASGCIYLLVGFESMSQKSLNEIHKGFNKQGDFRSEVDALHAHGISIQGCFIFGFDHDDKTVFDATVEQVNELKIDIPRYSLLTPYPETPLFRRLMGEGRLLSTNWDDYDTMHAVFEPKNMTTDELYDGFKHAYAQTFKVKQIASRTRWGSINGLVNFVGNLTYRKFVHRLFHDPRYARPFTPGFAPRPDEVQAVSSLEAACRT